MKPITEPVSRALSWALQYFAWGLAVIFYSHGTKAPREKDWHHNRHSEADIRRLATDHVNVGVILGQASNGLTDVDLDSPTAVRIAPAFLPATGAIFGRASKPNSHWLYTTTLAQEVEKAAIQFKDPETNEMLVEIRIGGGGRAAQMMFPGSVH